MHWLSQKRSPFWQKNLATNIALGFLGLYMLASTFFVGFFINKVLLEEGEIIRDIKTSKETLRELEKYFAVTV